jgi:predicted dehydrogenase
MSKPVKLIIVGAGARGTTYAEYALAHPDRAKVVAVAEPRELYRKQLACAHQIAAESVYDDWQAVADRAPFADAVVIATQDTMHVEPTLAFAKLGYHLLLEKPMAPTPEGCQQIVGAVQENGKIFAVCHVMRYTAYSRKLKEIVDSELIGDLVNIQHLEPVGYWHHAHSYVRGNWRSESLSSSMLLAKSCHDLDWLRYIMGVQCERVSSFGSLMHFKKENQPPNAAERCLDCDYEPQCPYSAKKIYLDRVAQGITHFPVNIITPDHTIAGVTEALRNGPYGRCVYDCDNDVVDHQVVNLQFKGGQTATFTMTGFNQGSGRITRIFGTRGELRGDGSSIEHFDFLTEKTRIIKTPAPDQTILGGHGGGDYALMDSFISAVASNDSGRILSGAEESLETHMMVFAAEKARRSGSVEEILL